MELLKFIYDRPWETISLVFMLGLIVESILKRVIRAWRGDDD